MYGTRLSALFILLTLPWVQTAHAERFYPLISYQCDVAANMIKISNRMLPATTGKDYPYAEADGSYSPWHLVDIGEINGAPRVTGKRKITKVCKLSSGDYTITLAPLVFSNDVTTRCGQTISATVSVEYNGEEIQEALPFEGFCIGNAPIITEVIVSGQTQSVKLKRVAKFQFY